MKAVFDKEMRAKAAQQKKAMFMIAVEGQYAKRDSFTFAGPGEPEEIALVEKCFVKLCEMHGKRKRGK